MTHKARRFDLSPDNFIGGVSGVLNATELGVYWAICLLIYSNGGPIPYDEMRLKSFLRGTHIKAIRCSISRLETLGKVTVKDGYIGAKGCVKPIEDASNRVLKAIENGSKGGRPSIKNNTLSKPEAFNSEKLTSTTITTTNHNKKASPFVLPSWVPEEPWNGYVALRRQKRAPGTERALKLIIKDLDKLRTEGHDPGDVLDNCVKRGWIGIFPPNNGNGNRNGKPDKSAHDKFFAAGESLVRELLGEAGNGDDRHAADAAGYELLPPRLHGGPS